ncbi:hypothetical protein LCGC14_1669940, partial [marine sediment metagenome]
MTQDQALEILKNNKDELEGILSRFTRTSAGIHINRDDDARFREIVIEMRDLFNDEFVDNRNYTIPLANYFNNSISNFVRSPSYKGVENIKGLISAARARVERNPLALKSMQVTPGIEYSKNPGYLDVIVDRFHILARQIRQRHNSRNTLEIEDEYDVQDLFHSLLSLFYDDIRDEEWTPSYAGGASRVDFLLPEIETVVEVKKTRATLSTK